MAFKGPLLLLLCVACYAQGDYWLSKNAKYNGGGENGGRQEHCEGHGFSYDVCMKRGCCIFYSDQCFFGGSDGTPCVDTEDGVPAYKKGGAHSNGNNPGVLLQGEHPVDLEEAAELSRIDAAAESAVAKIDAAATEAKGKVKDALHVDDSAIKTALAPTAH